MRRLLSNALLIAGIAVAVWFMKGDASRTSPVPYGVPVALECLVGQIEGSTISEGAMSSYTIWWTTTEGVNNAFNGSLTGTCTLYPIGDTEVSTGPDNEKPQGGD